MSGRLETGRLGEDRVVAWYEAEGYRILDRNWRTRTGEIDIVAARDSVVVFCEVKTRSSARFGRGVEAVGQAKRRRIRSLALQWLQQSASRYPDIRFDVAGVDGDGTIEVIEDCF